MKIFNTDITIMADQRYSNPIKYVAKRTLR